ncbi:MAG: hypothetical protein H6647_20085 [Anaerolineales bacterium]|nr:hypothetical protein [Anaerolineales bacterium]
MLIARNLLERSDGEAERLALHQVLADVARTKLEPAAIERHRDYYLALVDEDREDWQRIVDGLSAGNAGVGVAGRVCDLMTSEFSISTGL